MKSILYIQLFILLLYNTGCEKVAICIKGKEGLERRTIEVSSFKEIEYEGEGTLFLSQGPEQKVEVETNKDLLQYFNTKVGANEVWRAGFNKCTDQKTLNIYVTVKDIRRIKLYGSGQIIGNSPITSDKFQVDLSGSGTISMEAISNYLSTSLSGSGDIKLKGSSNELNVSVDGSGNVDTKKLGANNVNTTTKGSGNIQVSANQTLNSTIKGSGSVLYSGTPLVNSSIKGSGSVSRL